MKNLMSMLKSTGKLASENSPALLTAIGVTGTVTAIFLTGKATFKAAEVLVSAQDFQDQGCDEEPLPLEFKEKFQLTWKLYIPAVGTTLITIACIIAANRIGARQAAGLAAAYTTSEKLFKEYQTKVVEKMGPRKEATMHEEISQERLDKIPVGSKEIIMLGGGDVPCYDELGGRLFMTTLQRIHNAEIDTNRLMLNDGYASLSDFYGYLGLDATTAGDQIGWRVEDKIDVRVDTVQYNDKPCFSLGFRRGPYEGYRRFH